MNLDRELLEEEIRTLAHQCKCRDFSGPCRFCMKSEKLERKLDKLEAHDEAMGLVSRWLFANGHEAAAVALGCADARGELRKPEKT